MAKVKSRSAAIITIKDPDKMTPAGRRQVATWMRRQANFLSKYGNRMASRFTARYVYD